MFKKVKPYMGEYMNYTKKAIVCICAAIIFSVLPYFFLYQIIEPLITGQALSLPKIVVIVALTAVCMTGNALLYAKAIKQLLEEAKIRYFFLPPYSADLNPIENLWSKVKALLRKFKARTLETLPDAIQRAFRAVTPSDCSGWFRACGYSR